LSLARPRTRHCCPPGRHRHHRSAGPACHVRSVLPWLHLSQHARSCGHRGHRQNLRLEVHHGDQLVVLDHPLGPHARVVDVLPGALRVEPQRRPPGTPVPLRRGNTFRVAASHFVLGSGQLGRSPSPMPQKRQVKGRVSSGGRGGHTPVDAAGPQTSSAAPTSRRTTNNADQ
jgi:hypothetical protein